MPNRVVCIVATALDPIDTNDSYNNGDSSIIPTTPIHKLTPSSLPKCLLHNPIDHGSCSLTLAVSAYVDLIVDQYLAQMLNLHSGHLTFPSDLRLRACQRHPSRLGQPLHLSNKSKWRLAETRAWRSPARQSMVRRV